MIFLSVADACQHLGIDPKTLHRWLTHAHLSLQAHPGDARKHSLSEDDLRQLVRLHQRALPLRPALPLAPLSTARPSLPAELLALPQTLSALQDQLTALQQQVAELTHLLQPHVHPPAPAPQAKAAKQTPTPTAAAPSSRRAAAAAATPPRKPVHVIPRVEWTSDGHYVVICPKHGLLPLEPDTPAWFAWLARQSSFRFVGKLDRSTAHHAWRVPRGAWRAHRQIRNHSYTLRLAPTQELTIAVLEQAAEALQAHLT
jgi:hypothetical protein